MSLPFSDTCPGHVSPELWDGMSADAKYQVHVAARRASQRLSWMQWIMLTPPLLFMALSPIQAWVYQHWSPFHYVKLTGTADPRMSLDTSEPVVGDLISGYEVSSAFGPRIHPVTFTPSHHRGVDIAAPTGTPLYAPAVGADRVTVRCWVDDQGGGTVAEIASASIPAYRFKALHLDSCTEGTYTGGERFATVGATGQVTGAHLHLAQLSAEADVYLPPMTGYIDWFFSGHAGANLIDIPALKAAIISQESGGDPSAVNPHSGALGLAQVMPENLAGEKKGWDYEALGRDVSAPEFLANPDIQTAIIEHQLSEIARSQSRHADGRLRAPLEIAKRSAAVWYSGRGDYCQRTAAEYFRKHEYPSGAEYCEAIGHHYQRLQSSWPASLRD